MRQIRSHMMMAAGGLGLLVAGWFLAQATPSPVAQAQGKGVPEKKPILEPNDDRDVLAIVNGVPITRRELGDELIARKGKEQLKMLINRKIIEHACSKEGVTVTDQEVHDDLMNMAKSFGCQSLAEFERSVLRDKKIVLHEYKEDVTRPALMMKKLAGKKCEPTAEELEKAFEANFGVKIQCRMILEKEKRKAQAMWVKVDGRTETEFKEVARTQADPRLASSAGLVAPINRFGALGAVEKAAFELKDGKVSEVIETPEGFVILYRIKEVPATMDKKQFKQVEEMLRQDIHAKKVALKAPELFKKLEEEAKVQDYLNYQSTFMDVSKRIDDKKNPGAKPVPVPDESKDQSYPVPPDPDQSAPAKGVNPGKGGKE